MKEYQFKLDCSVWLDVNADSWDDAVELLNAELPKLDEPLPAPGRIQRVLVDIQRTVAAADIASVYDLDRREAGEVQGE